MRLTNNDFSQLLSVFMDLKMQLIENTGERVIHVNENSVSPINELMNALMSGKVPGISDSDTYIVNYYMKPTFDKSEIKFGVSDNIKFDNIIGPNNENILSVVNKDDIVPCNIFKLKLNKEQVSRKLKEFINQWAPTMHQSYVKYDGKHSLNISNGTTYPDDLKHVKIGNNNASIGWNKTGKGNYQYNVVAIYNYNENE